MYVMKVASANGKCRCLSSERFYQWNFSGRKHKDRQSTYNVALKRVRAIIFVEEKQ